MKLFKEFFHRISPDYVVVIIVKVLKGESAYGFTFSDIAPCLSIFFFELRSESVKFQVVTSPGWTAGV